jgi:predicted secreted acid phosphatase
VKVNLLYQTLKNEINKRQKKMASQVLDLDEDVLDSILDTTGNEGDIDYSSGTVTYDDGED